ncbi:probable chitinase 10 [Ceratitis capitata]|uniref:(Mediterranean fruit fly) hypothetical protein n=1 Tax=Ceratitis capitata TaxID=7213 RepID=A0A811V0V9_CERCA|nr:probable chitinase 10 [Ceratitis capitata]CAD7005109.1 unnamed protein product [Ceratitis capitata]
MLPLILWLSFIYGLNAEIEDLSQVLCKDTSVGDVVPNPRDCNSYFVCGTVPLISFCAQGLHFDAKNKVCNWPELAKCKLNESISLTKYIPGNVVNTSAAKVFSNHLSGPTLELKQNREDVTQETPLDPQFISYVALDVNTHETINPMVGYDSKNIACKHYGAYFLPHPADCNQYYMCVFGYIFQHKCGRGTGWNYKRQVCEIRPLTECYSSATTVQINNAQPSPGPLTEFSSDQLLDTPPTDGVYTVCYVLNNGVAGRPTWVPQDITTLPNSSPPIINWQSTRTPPSLVTPSSTGREHPSDLVIPICPGEDKVYLAHPSNCSKYYICIIGMPVLTSCPEGLYWNSRTEFCDSPVNVECSQ